MVVSAGCVEDAIIVAGGIGSRMLPASSMVAKEALPLVDVPILYHLCWEAMAAGVKRIHLVISPRKEGLDEKLKPSVDEVRMLSESRPELPIDAIRAVPEEVQVMTHIQEVPLGMADAVQQALRGISGPALVLLGDNLLMDSHPSSLEMGIASASSASRRLVESYSNTGRPAAGLWSVPDDEVVHYGVVEMDDDRIIDIVEKPSIEEAPSKLVLCGRYLWTAETSELLDTSITVEEHGELQSIALFHHWITEEGGMIGIDMSDCQWYDSGNPQSWLQAQIDHALRRQDLSGELRAWLDLRLNR